MREIFKNKGIKWENIYYEKNETTILIKLIKCNTNEEYEALIDSEDFTLVKNPIFRVYIRRKDTNLKNIPYILTSIKPKNKNRHYDYQLHQLIMNTKHKNIIIDHKNMNRFDNRKCNLRIVTAKENRLNQEYIGYRFDGINYVPSFSIDRIEFDLGKFKTKEETLNIFLKACLISNRDKISVDINNKIKENNIKLYEEDLYKYGLYDVFYYVCNGVVPKVNNDDKVNKYYKVNNDDKINKYAKALDGINFDKATNKWLVRVNIENKLYNMGRYEDLYYAQNIYREIKYCFENNINNSENKYVQKAIDIKNGNYNPDKYNGRKNKFYDNHKEEIIDLINKGYSYHKVEIILKDIYPNDKIKSDTIKKYYLEWENK